MILVLKIIGKSPNLQSLSSSTKGQESAQTPSRLLSEAVELLPVAAACPPRPEGSSPLSHTPPGSGGWRQPAFPSSLPEVLSRC